MDIRLANGTRLHLIGDPHLGKKFEVGIPLRYRGLREASQFQDFRNRLESNADVIVMVGDLFDYPYVPFAVVHEAAAAIASAAERNPDVQYVMMAGNHDLPRNATAVGAFHDLEQRLIDRYDNLHIVRRPTVINEIAMLPWEWDRRADEQVKDIANETVIAAVGHWDLATFSEGSNDHLAPVSALFASFGEIPLFSGHYHVAGDYEVDGAVIVCTGSLQPYSHSEDTSGALYVTATRDEALSAPDGHFKGKHLRVLLQPGEDLPDVDALAVIPKRLTSQNQPKTADKDTVSLSDFDWNKILSSRIEPLDPKVRDFIKERIPYDAPEQRGSGDQAVRQSPADGDSSED